MASPQHECEYLRMLEVQQQQCLEEEVQLENETTGESAEGRGVPSPLMSQAQSNACAFHNSQPDGH